jgi:hypothetical protein
MGTNAGAGLFIGALFVFVVSLVKGWPVLPWIAAAVMIGTLVAIGGQLQGPRRDKGGPDTRGDRPWRDR